jgi:hypothetical protein
MSFGVSVSRFAALALVLAFAGVVVAIAVVRATPLPEESRYVGSSECAACHRREHAAWAASQHTKMMRKPDAPGVVVADFSAPDTPFERSEVHWVIGGKWEQQFMGHDGRTETLLPGAWHNATGRWQLVGWDGWNQPIPLERCHGCHTVGLDVATGKFVEPNIGCESCHGPSSWHVETLGLGRVISVADAEACGQCHARGRNVDGRLHFPTGYRPGGDLRASFTMSEPGRLQNEKNWWGSGHAQSRHQEFQEWERGGHANSLRTLREGYDGRFGEVSEDCLRCHAGEAALDPERGMALEEARLGITCTVCHNVHGDLDRARIDCVDCHEGGAFYHEPERNARHVPCPSSARVSCVDCHMPRTVAIGGAIQFHSHSPGVIEPRAALEWGMPTSCSQGVCHSKDDPEPLQVAFDQFYRNSEKP